MSSLFPVNANGKRIKTDILVVGWVREFSISNKLIIPKDITNTCFVFWLLKVCDEWDKYYSTAHYRFSNDSVSLQVKDDEDGHLDYTPSMYGSHSIGSGSYQWTITIKRNVDWICVGIIEDKHKILQKFLTENDYDYENGGFVMLPTGVIYYRGGITFDFCDELKGSWDESLIVIMTLNMDDHTLSYKINDKDYGIAMEDIPQKSYRFVINMNHDGDEVEFL